MNILTYFYTINATLIILHEIESGYEREWEILKLPGGITGFLLLHLPILLLFFYGLLEIDRLTNIGLIIGAITGFGGLIPFLVHKKVVKRKDEFNLLISSIIIYSNIFFGLKKKILRLKKL